jgi:hypothetical protein
MGNREKSLRAHARNRGRRWLWERIKELNGIQKSCPSNKVLRQWVHSHPQILPEKHRPRLLEASAKNLPVEMGYILKGTTKFAAEKGPYLASKKKRDTFYSSWEWKKARFEAIKKYGPVCMCCGSAERIVVDHIKPRSKFPEIELDLDNLQILCNDCNMGKSNDDYTDFRPKGDELSRTELVELEIIEESEKWH